MVAIKKGTSIYLIWKEKQNKKTLFRRVKQQIRKKVKKQFRKQDTKLCAASYNKAQQRYEFKCPRDFSFETNTDETVLFFSGVLEFIKRGTKARGRIYFNLSEIEHLGVDALMYLIAIINNLKEKYLRRIDLFSGNFPENSEAKRLLDESGFSKFVTSVTPPGKKSANLQILSGSNINVEAASSVSDFIVNKTGIGKRECSFVYNIIVELMSNTIQHAYIEEFLHRRWYLFAENNGEKFKFSFVDTGLGISATVRKNWHEYLPLPLTKKKDEDLILSALKGEFRTSTKMKNRGNGLPKIREYCGDNKIQNLCIISNAARVVLEGTNSQVESLKSKLFGTIFTWEIHTSSLKGAKNNV